MRDTIGSFRGLDKEFAHTSDIVSSHVVSLRAHQFCRVEIHTVILLALLISATKNFGRGQVPHTNGLTFSRQGTLPTRPLALWLVPRAISSGYPADKPFSGSTGAPAN